MAFQEYPKSLYLRGWDDLDAVVVVADEEAEANARAQGYRHIAEFPQPGESAPLAAAPEQAPDPEPATPLDADGDGTVTREELWAALDAKGVDYDRRWGVARLRALLEA